ncbi:polyhydroxyalkanoate synthesis regulator DNA-binding domain-containing protein [Polynucleobacter sp. JS-JIR-5-A7]|uniref:polyhydroxyalkanoate synthesis regulator DNA-binding domain-containing protein n=1 Tax=Polynucleobacter sp. JS-JIR-5-A7 TaxID=1758395 RepID=UPI001BFDB2B4|nr:polyhydroxyalkanoate synthesis regulator DNA-binding domain-containing protein [Polynucleobacter sp. JS-JIR-5-A7]QWE06067.1 hypothetical protein AOC29_08070 [Polynucleobacter sp. JS-JIR-5-A7]
MKPITYVKYPNRRLYDTENSCYVTFPNLRLKIMEGRDIVVLDNKTKEDVTREVLVSIIMEESFVGEPLFSEDLMKMIIRFYGNPMQALLTNSLDQGLQILTGIWSTLSANKKNTEDSK